MNFTLVTLSTLAALAALEDGAGGVHAKTTPSSGLRGGRQLQSPTRVLRSVDVQFATKVVSRKIQTEQTNCGVGSDKRTYWRRDNVNLRVKERAYTGEETYLSMYNIRDAEAYSPYEDHSYLYKESASVLECAPGAPSDSMVVAALSSDTVLFAEARYLGQDTTDAKTEYTIEAKILDSPTSIFDDSNIKREKVQFSSFVHEMQDCSQVYTRGLKKLIARKKGRFLEETDDEELAVIMPESFAVDDADNSTTIPLVFTNNGGTAIEVDVCMYAPEGYELDSVLDEDGATVESEQISCVHTLLTAADTTFLFEMSEAPAGGRMLKDKAQSAEVDAVVLEIKTNNGNKFVEKIKKNKGKKKN